MNSCQSCGGKIEDGTLHSCTTGTLRAPWLFEILKAQHEELKLIREFLQVTAAGQILKPAHVENPESKTRASKRETR